MSVKHSAIPKRAPTIWRPNRWLSLALIALLACDLLLWLPAPHVLQSWAALGLAALLPGALLVDLWLGRREATLAVAPLGPGARVVYGVGAGYGLLVLVMLGLSYLPGGLSFAVVALTFNAIVVVLLILRLRVDRMTPLPPATPWRWPVLNWQTVSLAALLLGAAFLRFTHLGYSELHGDEALVALRALDVMQGWERALFIHKKGPGEILLGTAMYVLTGRLTEYTAHLPFALASWTGVLAVYLLGRRWFGAIAGWWAGAMVAVDGYLLAFGRMLQYQSIVFLLVVLTVLAMQMAVERAQAGEQKSSARHLLLAAFLMATGLLAHYEASLAVVPAAWLLICLWQAQPGPPLDRLRRTARQMVAPLLLGTAILALFYVPFVLDPEFLRDTVYYLFDYRLGGETVPEGWAIIVGRSTLYSSSYYFWTLVALTLIGLLVTYRRYAPRWSQIPLMLLLAGVMTALLVNSAGFFETLGRAGLLLFALIFAPLWLSPRVTAGERAAWLWFSVPLLGVMFFVRKPGTHVYIFFIPWALVTGHVVGQIWRAIVDRWVERWGTRTARLLLAPLLLVAVLVFGNYGRWLFVVNDPEVLRTWDENRPAGYWTSYDSPSFESIFGFPIRNGWQTIAALYAQGEMAGRFDTNDRFSMLPDWYLRGEAYCPRDDPNYYLLVPYPLPVDRPLVETQRQQLAADYYLWGTITSNEQPHLEIYAQAGRMAAARDEPPRIFRSEDYVDFFDEQLLDPFTPNGPLGAQPILHPLDFRFGEHMGLLGYDIQGDVDRAQLSPGGELEVELYWTTDAPLATDYFISLQIIDLADARKAGQRDGEPGCNRFPTTRWVPGDRLFDRYHVPVEPEAEPGEYALYLTVYAVGEDGTQTSLPVFNAQGEESSGVALTAVTVTAKVDEKR